MSRINIEQARRAGEQKGLSMATLIRTDRNGTKYYVEQRCPRCNGTGYVYGFEHVDGGRCFLCGGSGIHEYTWKERTPEYEQKLADRRAERERTKAPKINEAFLEREGFSQDGTTWVVVGDTYKIKDELRDAGAKYSPLLGWHFAESTDDYATLPVDVRQLTSVNDLGIIYYDDAYAKMQAILDASKPTSTSEYIGDIGQRVTIQCTYNGYGYYETHFTYNGETHYVLKFTDGDGNKIVWDTCSWQDLEEGKQYTVTGTVKAHKEYKGEKQTSLSRCRIV